MHAAHTYQLKMRVLRKSLLAQGLPSSVSTGAFDDLILERVAL